MLGASNRLHLVSLLPKVKQVRPRRRWNALNLQQIKSFMGSPPRRSHHPLRNSRLRKERGGADTLPLARTFSRTGLQGIRLAYDGKAASFHLSCEIKNAKGLHTIRRDRIFVLHDSDVAKPVSMRAFTIS